MATNQHDEYDVLRNPSVDYDRTDLSPRGILVFLVGLLVAGIFVELVLWGMFHFLSRSPFFARGNTSPMVSSEKMPSAKVEGVDFENAPNMNPDRFPQPRLQTNDARDMQDLLQTEHKILYAEQPFVDHNGTVHLPIDEAMKLIVQRGLPLRSAGAASVAQKTAPAGEDVAPKATTKQ
ncbi:MAG TPA: hypothetical protein VMT53_06380 [Terriglobales bacterium]|nr:hypothetical protein [Terriglobales bacterium]